MNKNEFQTKPESIEFGYPHNKGRDKAQKKKNFEIFYLDFIGAYLIIKEYGLFTKNRVFAKAPGTRIRSWQVYEGFNAIQPSV